MTYSNTSPVTNPSSLTAQNTAPDLDPAHTAYVAGVSPVIAAVMMRIFVWLCSTQTPRTSGRFTACAKTTAAISALAMMFVVLPGTFAQKKALLDSLSEKLEAKFARLLAKYLVWRQRKCWMWGGGFFAGALTRLPRVFGKASDRQSFEALIPD